MDMDRALPSSIEAERATLGSVLLNRDAIAAIAAWLLPDDFYFQQNAWIYEAMLGCFNNRVPPDTRLVADELRRRQRLDEIGGLPYLLALIDAVPSSYHIEFYATVVQRTAVLRQLIGIGGRIAGLGYDEATELDVTLDKADQLLFAVTQRTAKEGYVPISTVIDRTYERLIAMQESVDDGADGISGVPTGFIDLDDVTGGLQASDLILLAGRPGMGKTSLVLNLAYNMAVQHALPSGIISLEMSKDQLTHKLISTRSGVSVIDLLRGRLRDSQMEAVLEAMGHLASLPIHIDDEAGMDIHTIRHKARRMCAKEGIRALFIDHIQIVRGAGENRVQEVSAISRQLKQLARELKIPVIALSQLSRGVEGRAEHRPLLSDLRDSGSLEQDADIVMFMYRDEYYAGKNSDNVGVTELILAKHRNGPCCTVPLRFDANTTSFSSLAYLTPPASPVFTRSR